MAFGNFFSKAKDVTTGLFNRFFYDDTAPRYAQEEQEDAREAQEGQYVEQPPFAPQQGDAQGFDPYRYQQQAAQYQQPQYQQAQYQQPQYQQAQYQQAQYQQPQYQQPQQPMYSQFAAQQPPQVRNRRVQQHAQAEQPAPQEENVVRFPGAYQQEQQAAQEGNLNMRVINVRGINDCRSAISLLRGGDALIVVMDGVSDPAEMRRYVDTLSGACFSLSSTITKVSRYGAYLIAPASVSVYADQTTSQMNNPARPPIQRYGQGYQQAQYQPQAPYQQPQQAYQQPYQQPYARPAYDAQGFERRAPAPEEQQDAFYAQRAPAAPAAPAFEPQPTGYGYAPDRAEAAE